MLLRNGNRLHRIVVLATSKQRNLQYLWKFWTSLQACRKQKNNCKILFFCYHETTKINLKTDPKTQKSASGPGHLRNRKKKIAHQKHEIKWLKNTGFFVYVCRFWTGAFINRFLPYFCLSYFFKARVTTYKMKRFSLKNETPPGKPSTFYECHPENHAPVPSLQTD